MQFSKLKPKMTRAYTLLIREGRKAAQAFLETEPDAQKRLEKVSDLIYG